MADSKKPTLVVVAVGAVLPGQVAGQRGEEVVDCPGDNHVVVQPDETLGDEVDKSETFKEWGKLGVDSDGPHGAVLAQLEL